MYIADLHIHSRYSRATSKECVPEYLDLWARRKGIHLLGTGDFTHPAWRQELREKLIPAEDGLYCLKKELRLKDSVRGKEYAPRFVVSGEISSIYKKNGRVRKVHNLILLPGLAEAERLSERLEQIGNLHSDGRPILGLDSRDLLEITLEICPRTIFVPAHIWTPHFSMFGAFSGFDTVEECFEDLTPMIHAFETGLSSDPPMNWRLSALDRFQMISNSDAHSPARLGREANLLDIPLCYDGLYGAIQEGKGLEGTIEFFPEEGKYHYDGHRKCHLCLSPREAEQFQGRCPVCGKKLTLGVSHRIAQLADREEGFIRLGAVPFESLVPLPEVIAACMGCSAASVKVGRQYREMLAALGTEFSILRECSPDEIQSQCGYQIAEGIRRLRQGRVLRHPGFDGEYGVIGLFEPSELGTMEGQMSLFDLGGAGLAVRAAEAAGAKGLKGTEKPGIAGGAGADKAADMAGAVSTAESPGTRETAGMIQTAGIAGAENARAAEAARAGNARTAEAAGAGNARTAEAARAGNARTADTAGAGNVRAADTAGAGKPDRAAPEAENDEQLLAVRSVSPRIAVIAGPGTGKTKTLISRILYLLQNRRVRPSEIMAVTFTNQAAREMRTRLEERLGRRNVTGKLRIGTFHALCHSLLKDSGREFVLAGEDMARELVKEAAGELGISGSPKTLRQKISRRKVNLAEQAWESKAAGQAGEERATREEEEGKTAGEEISQTDRMLRRYQEKLTALGAWDFDDLLIQALQLAHEETPPVPYLLVDEFQDISPLQYRLIEAWSRGGREVFIIGDPDQAIYGFRGADCESFLRFCKEENTRVFRLRINYRSSPEILKAAEAVLEGNARICGELPAAGRSLHEPAQESGLPAAGRSRREPAREFGLPAAGRSRREPAREFGFSAMDRISLRPVRESGLPVRMVQAAREREEAVFIAKAINRLIGGIDMLDVQEGFAGADHGSLRSFADIAVLYRTHRQAELLETCLKKEGIPYVVTGREDFLEEQTVRGGLSFFHSILNPEDHLSQRLCRKLLWNLSSGDASATEKGENVRDEYTVLAEKYRNSCRRKTPEKVWESWIRDMGLKEDPAMGKLLSMAVFYRTMEEMLTALAFGREADLKRCGGKHYTSDAVTLMTMHGSKGLEFPAVFLYGLREGIVPLEYQGRETDRAEERRLLYVAMTRAREELILTTSGEISSLISQVPGDILLRERTRVQEKDRDNGRQLSLFDSFEPPVSDGFSVEEVRGSGYEA